MKVLFLCRQSDLTDGKYGCDVIARQLVAVCSEMTG
jgi:hypothetical protein